jgi:hypothetical protein
LPCSMRLRMSACDTLRPKPPFRFRPVLTISRSMKDRCGTGTALGHDRPSPHGPQARRSARDRLRRRRSVQCQDAPGCGPGRARSRHHCCPHERAAGTVLGSFARGALPNVGETPSERADAPLTWAPARWSPGRGRRSAQRLQRLHILRQLLPRRSDAPASALFRFRL